MAKATWVGLEPGPFERQHHAIQVCAYGEPGIGKSWFFSTFQNPKVVFGFDTPGKLRVYLEPVLAAGGKELPEVRTADDIRVWQAVDAKGQLAVRVEIYRDPRVDSPNAFPVFQDRFIQFVEKEQQKWAGAFLDSATFMGLHARKWSQYDQNEGVKHGAKHYAVQTDEMEEQLLLQMPSLECDAGVTMHVSKKMIESEGSMVRAPMAPGRLLDTTGAGWPELYYVWVDTTGDKKIRRLQTENDGKFQALSCLKVPDGTRAEYKRLWKHLEKKG